jgi:hypothetical protein
MHQLTMLLWRSYSVSATESHLGCLPVDCAACQSTVLPVRHSVVAAAVSLSDESCVSSVRWYHTVLCVDHHTHRASTLSLKSLSQRGAAQWLLYTMGSVPCSLGLWVGLRVQPVSSGSTGWDEPNMCRQSNMCLA